MARRNVRVPAGRLMEAVNALERDGIERGRIMYRQCGSGAFGFCDVEVKVASSPLYVENVLRMQDRGERKSNHWRGFVTI